MELASAPSATASAQVLKLLTGIDPIDRVWGGFYRGGSYLVYGRAASGRDLLPLRFMQTGVQHGETGLLISPARPKDLMIQSASIGFNLRSAYEQGVVRLMRIPAVLSQQAEDDSGVIKALRDLVAIIRQYRPQRLVIHDFMPFMAFHSFDRLRTAFIEMLEQTDVLDMTMLLVMPQPANAQSARVIEFMRSQMTGSIQIEMDAERPDSTERRLVLMPNIGHLQRQTKEPWDLRDVVVDEPAPGAPGPRHLPEKNPEPAPLEEAEPEVAELPETSYYDDARAAAGFATPYPSIPLGTTRARPARGTTPGVRLGAETRPVPPSGSAAEMPWQPSLAPPPPPAYTSSVQRSGSYITSSVAGFPPSPAGATAMPPVARAGSAQALRSNREAFAARLQQHFVQRDAGNHPFLLIALRIESQARQSPFDFEMLSDLVLEGLEEQDDAFVEAQHERLVVFLADAQPEQQHLFFARLKERMRAQIPQQAEGLIHAVSAFVVPNGQPFGTAADFLGYVLDGPAQR